MITVKRLTYVAAIASLSLTACKSTTKEYYEDAEGVLKKECQLGYFSDKVSGTCTHYSKEGGVFLKEQYKDDVLHGKVLHFEEGKETVVENYKDGVLHGESRGVTLDGVVWLEANYVNGKLEGKHILRHGNGNLKVEEMYNSQGKEGVQKKYYKNGQLAHSATYKDGCLITVDEVYTEDGRVLNAGNYKDGNGNLSVYYGNGQLRYYGSIREYKQVGEWKMMSKKGRTKTKHNYNPQDVEPCEFKYIPY